MLTEAKKKNKKNFLNILNLLDISMNWAKKVIAFLQGSDVCFSFLEFMWIIL